MGEPRTANSEVDWGVGYERDSEQGRQPMGGAQRGGEQAVTPDARTPLPEREGASAATRLTRVLTVLSGHGDLDALVARLLEALSESFTADVVSLLLADGDALRESATLGLDVSPGRTRDDRCAEQVFATLEPVRAGVSPDGGALAAAGVDQGVWLPVQGMADAVGVLRLLRAGAAFSDEDVEVLSAVAFRVGLAVEADRLRARDRQRSAMRERMLGITAEMARRLEFGPVAQRIVEGVTAVTDFSCAVVALRDGPVCRRLAASGLVDARIGLETPYAEWAALLDPAQRRGELCHRFPPAATALGTPHADEPAEGGHETGISGHGLVLALTDPDGDTVGFLAVAWPRSGRAPEDETVAALELFARQAQVALANARLFEIVRRQRDAATTLRRVSEAVSSSLELDDVLRRCCDEVTAVSVGDRTSIYLFDSDRDIFLPVISRAAEARPDLAARFRQLPPAPADTMPAFTHALATRTPVAIQDTSCSADLRLDDVELLNLTTAAIYPMRAGGEDVGVLVVGAVHRSDPFPPDEVALLHQVAGEAAVAVRQARLYAETRALAGTMRELYDIAKTVSSTFDVEVMFTRIADSVRERLGAQALTMFEVTGATVQIVRADYPDGRQVTIPKVHSRLDPTVAHLLERLREEGTVVVPDVARWPELERVSLPETRSLLIAAHLEHGDVRVGLAVSSPRVHAFGPADAAFLGHLVETTGLALRHARLYVETRTAAERDSLTGLRNRRVFWADLKRLLTDPTAAPVALAVIDIDDFKRINDDNGHDAGDRALVHVADRLTRSVRQTDAVYRIGGEEFTVVMGATTGEAACGVMERSRDAVQRSRAASAEMSISVGIAVGGRATTSDALFRSADRALYTAKRAGKDRVALAGDSAHLRPELG